MQEMKRERERYLITLRSSPILFSDKGIFLVSGVLMPIKMKKSIESRKNNTNNSTHYRLKQ